jgi:hypothetical protein
MILTIKLKTELDPNVYLLEVAVVSETCLVSQIFDEFELL